MIRWVSATILATALIFGLATPAEGDTVMLKSGVRINGTIVHQDDDTVRIRIGDREQTYPATKIAVLEENDHTGKLDPAELIRRGEQRAAELFRETGLTADQRREVKELMYELQSTDSDIHDNAKRSLVKFHKKVPLHKYFAWWLPGLSPRFVPGVLEIMGEIAPDRAAQVAASHVTDADATSRAMALTVLAKTAGLEKLDIIARGAVDPESEVRIAASRALGQMKAREATPLLIENVDAPDPHLVNVARAALRHTWSTDTRPIDFETKADWQSFWDQKKSTVESPLTQVAMLPLVEPGAVFEDE